ncbi:MAG: NAD(P)H-hydrate dehydratase [Acidobacteria bacterium]|nr:NAD(P)H-hydrate dehydratase [Acidobacteriota bacterium]MBK9529366.1 NAD(P)H-hydrate dehydratase [Acidobacteriota bacterium]MBP7475714.1 NAD(P)H-hydrate dehydratase [Pyrinomonadaceae bacterium]MBP9110413.1 NAD(P)H-hydrate dehydratase [Pyrinomonadaceae bacterium]
MQKVLTAEQMREVDRLTTERYGIPSILLMENAAHAVARVITEKLGGSVNDRRINILAGKGNNGGDGAALARILWTQGANCFVYLFGSVSELSGDARLNFDAIKTFDDSEGTNGPNESCLILFADYDPNDFSVPAHHDVVVDALFGTGLSRPIDGPVGDLVARLGRQRSRFPQLFVSIDIPSGLTSNYSDIIGPVFPADVTITFTAMKVANIMPPASVSNGEIVLANIGSPPDLIEEQPSKFFLAEKPDARVWLKSTDFFDESYKNKRGHALIVAGSEDYSGAAVMCGNVAMRSGVGLTTMLVPASCKVEVASRVIPEVIVRAIGEADGEVGSDAFAANEDVIEKADSILVGPGLKATDKGVEKFVREIVETRKVPVILDAGALWLFSPLKADDVQPPANAGGSPLILTPHEGEFIRLLGTDDKEAIKDRVAAVRDFAVTNNVILVLKGERVLIASPDGRVVVNPTGNSGLGKAGNGDTLAGILAGFVAQAVKFKIDIFETVVAAVYVAGMAGDVAEKKYGKRVMTASDVRECLVDVFAEFEKKE